MTPQLQKLLKEATAERLKVLVEATYGINAEVDQRIESVLLGNHPEELARQLKKRIKSIAHGRRFIDYYQAREFSRTMDLLVNDIAQLIEPVPKQAFELADQFMATHESVYERADDSGGDIGCNYSRGLAVWLKAAHRWRETGNCKLDWVNELLTRHNNNGYAAWDTLIANSGELLTKDELMQLVWRFETEFKQAHDVVPADRNDNFRAATAALGIAALAEALNDVTLFERSVLMVSPEPNELQKENIIKFCLSVNDGESALKWLTGSWDARFESERLTLLDNTYALLGRHRELLELRRSAYQRHPDHWRLKALLEVLPEEEKPAMQGQAVTNAMKIADIDSRIETLIALDAMTEAKEQLIAHFTHLDVFYSRLLNWANVFQQAQQTLAAVVCYRLLLEDILSSGRSKAYDHGVEYYRQLAKLDAGIQRYDPLPNWQEYQVQLRQQHGRKSSFWQRLG